MGNFDLYSIALTDKINCKKNLIFYENTCILLHFTGLLSKKLYLRQMLISMFIIYN